MAARPSSKAEAWEIFDHIVEAAAPGGEHSNPWVPGSDGQPFFHPDYDTLALLLGVPLHLKVGTQTGVPALALDVWLSYELRRAGFGTDQVWPRPANPRVLPAPVSAFVKSLPTAIRAKAQSHLTSNTSIPGVTSSSASILGKNYLKQVDVIITDWVTGPELLISTKRMDSSYGKNAPNRIEESYGDAKNLRLRHPIAALGFLFGLRSDILEKEPKTAEWLFDLLAKLGREDDAYHSTCLVLMDYSSDQALPVAVEEEPSEGILEPGPQPITDPAEDEIAHLADSTVENIVKTLPKVSILENQTPDDLSPARFLTSLVTRVLAATPVNMHEEARRRRASILPRK
ncbi:hypothetical protein FHS26_003696 [Rhizobium pisi]|uniref:Uncharacterized protein n=1 Tax=Rhizobium pisi TaxID=574561 RepID=A0A427MXB7_9HYPH|nr:hypothetical protein [Rhizobium pisi]MBB3135949.1 hypothetical protein [Rhizobium pisi]RSB75812.1 hypothetical protein EFD55_18520 [Rhizobium pisi]TCA55220.1 hypothetical protein E0J16_15985 [Rhizobium pisi]